MAGVMRGDVAEDDPEARKAKWEAARCPLFGPLYTYDELQEVEVAAAAPRRAGSKPNSQLETPADWPADTKIDPGPWVPWLPEGWKQAKRTNPANGNVLQCYFSPENKRYWHKKRIEQVLGRRLVDRNKKEEEEEGHDPSSPEGSKTRARYVTDDDAIPSWPDWLPKDWKVGFRQKHAALHKIMVPPNQEDKGFCWQKSNVLAYLAGEMGLSSFDSSRAGVSPSRSRSREPPARPKKVATDEDYEEVRNFKVFQLPLDMQDRKASSVEEGPSNFTKEELEEALKARGFKKPTLVLVAFFKHKKGKDLPSKPMIAKKMCGMWYKRKDGFNGRMCYQHVGLTRPGPNGRELFCSRAHIFWSAKYKCWKMGVLDEDFAGFMKCEEDVEHPWQTTKRWQVVKDQLCT